MTHTEWRVGRHYGIHVYEGERPVATFHNAADAALTVRLHNDPELVALRRDYRTLYDLTMGVRPMPEGPGRADVRAELEARYHQLTDDAEREGK